MKFICENFLCALQGDACQWDNHHTSNCEHRNRFLNSVLPIRARQPRDIKESRPTVRAKRPVQQAKVKTCPHCGSRKVEMFDSDNDHCLKCGKWFPGS